jgi:hypothetical protein
MIVINKDCNAHYFNTGKHVNPLKPKEGFKVGKGFTLNPGANTLSVEDVSALMQIAWFKNLTEQEIIEIQDDSIQPPVIEPPFPANPKGGKGSKKATALNQPPEDPSAPLDE